MAEAKQALSKNSGGNKAAKGRPLKNSFTREQLSIIEAVWVKPEHKNNQQRIADLQANYAAFKDFNEADYYRHVRPELSKPKRKPEGKE